MPRTVTYNPYKVKVNGKKRWRVFIPTMGKRDGLGKRIGSQKTFKTREEAETYATPYRESLKQCAPLSSDKCPSYIALEEMVMEEGFTDLQTFTEEMLIANSSARQQEFSGVTTALQHIIENQIQCVSNYTLTQLLTFYRQKHGDWSRSMLSTHRSCIKHLINTPAQRLAKYPVDQENEVSELLTRDIANAKANTLTSEFWYAYLEDFRQSPLFTSVRTYNGMLQSIKGAYALAVSTRQLQSNPVSEIKALAKVAKNPTVIRPDTLRTLLTLCARYEPRAVPYFVLVFYTGARPGEEAKRVKYRHIFTADDQKTITSIQIPRPDDRNEKTKTKKNRLVELDPCAAAWLLPYLKHNHPDNYLHPTGRDGKPSDTVRKNIRTDLIGGKYTDGKPLFTWDQENGTISRHSYATYFEAKYKDSPETRTKLQNHLGHTTFDTYQTFYQNDTVFQKRGKEYFNIYPTDTDLAHINQHLSS